jgi:signal transduction protein with GAF and PtsI domain
MKYPYKIIKTSEYTQLLSELKNQEEEMRRATEFVKKLDDFNLDIEYEGINNNAINEKPLVSALINMRNRMKEFSEKELERKWTTEGLAMFSEILHNTNISTFNLYDKVIANLVKYLHANQGGLFVINDDDNINTFIELVACYAYERKKYLNKKIESGEGLIGQCVLEVETIYLTEIPSQYVTITSGLGEATPRSLIIVPLKINEKIYGVIEIASFREFKNHERLFIEKLAESIASIIATSKTAERTQRLLEESQMKEEKLRAQEEEMRQNLEELHTTQEQMKRQEEEMINNMQEMVVSMQEDAIKKEQYYHTQIEELKAKLNLKVDHAC